ISNYTRSQAYLWSQPRDWDKIKVIHCGLDAQFLHAPKTPPPAAPRLVCVGRFGAQKGNLVLIEAAGRLAKDGVDFELTLIGDGPLRGEIESAIAVCGL